MRSLLCVAVMMGTCALWAQDSVQPQAGPPMHVRWVEREFMMPVPGAPSGIDVLQVEVEREGRHPLVILTHGSAEDPAERATVTPWVFLPQAMWFARRGYVVLVVVRKGYGRSTGEQDSRHGGCQSIGGRKL